MSIRRELGALGTGTGSTRRELTELLNTPPGGVIVHGDVAVVKSLAQGGKGGPSTARSGEATVNRSEADDDLTHSQWFEFLCRKGSSLLTRNLKGKEEVCSMLLKMADAVKVLPPADEPVAGDTLDMTLWKDSLAALIQEMKTVEKIFPSLIGSSGAFVLTATPYPAFLRALAAEIADRPDAAEK